MKRLFFLLSMAAYVCNYAVAQEIPSAKVPLHVMNAFKEKFPLVNNAKWEMENNAFEAEFKQDGKQMSATFENTGAWVETETDIELSALPEAIHSKFGDYKIKEASKVESAKHGSCYEIEVEKDKQKLEILVTPEGKTLSKKTEDKDKDKDDKD